jgi:hypothetical protein
MNGQKDAKFVILTSKFTQMISVASLEKKATWWYITQG